MIRKSTLAGLAVIGLASAPVAAQVAAPTTLAASSAAADEGTIGGAKWIALAMLAGVAAVLVLTITDDDGDDAPVSP